MADALTRSGRAPERASRVADGRRLDGPAAVRSRGDRGHAPAGVDQEPARLRGPALLGEVHEFDAIVDATVTFAAFCAVASSAGYLVNDAHDAELDRQHPTKRRRPIAAGELSIGRP